MHVTKDGKIKQPARKWYTLRETLVIHAKGGYVVLVLAPALKRGVHG